MISNGKKNCEDFETLFPLFMDITDDLFMIAQSEHEFKIEFINNSSFLEKLGYTHDTLIGTSFLNLVYSDDAKKIITFLKNQMETMKKYEEMRIKTSVQDLYWVKIIIKKYNGNIASNKVLINLRDISKRKELEIKLSDTKQNEEKYRELANLLPDIIFETDNVLKLTYVNSVALKKFGYTPEDLKEGLNVSNFIHPNYKEKALLHIKEIFEGKETEPNDYLLCKKDGSYFYARIHSRPVFKDGNIVGVRGTIRDINEMILAEQELRESEERFRTIAFQSFMGIIVIQDGIFKYFNEQAIKLNGYSIEEIKKWKPYEFAKLIHPDDREFVMEQAKKKEEGKKDVIQHHKYRIITKSGNIRWIENFSKSINYKGRPADLVMSIDVTNQLNAEEKLKSSEWRYRQLFENSPLGLIDLDFSEIKRYIDYLRSLEIDDFEKFLNDHPEEILKCIGKSKVIDVNKKSLDTYKAQSKEDFILRMNQIAQGNYNLLTEDVFLHNKKELLDLISGETEYEAEIVSQTFTGETIYLHAKTLILPGSEKTWSNVIVSIVDITNRKITEQKLKESEVKYHQLFETLPDGVVLTDSEGKIIECNSAIENITGYSTSEFIGKTFLELEIYDQNAVNLMERGFKDLFNENKIEFLEFPFIHKEGKLRWMQITGSLITIKGKLHILAVLHDITTIKMAEVALKKSREQYRDLLETSSIGILEIDVNKNQIEYINPKLLEIIGYKKEELSDFFIRDRIIHAKDLTKIMENHDEMELEFRITDKNGKLKWVSGKRIPHFDENEKLISTRLWLDDITEKKMYEELIYELNVNFLNFTADIQNNIKLLLNTGLKLLDGDLILYAHKVKSEDQEQYNIISSNNDSYTFDSKELSEKLLINEFFKEGHDFPQTFTNTDQGSYINTDPYIKEVQAKGCFGKVIRTQQGLDNIVCVFYKNNPIISGQDKLVLFLICDAIEIEQRRWQVQQDLEEQNITLNKINKFKTELLSRTSHELKTPLISIKGFTELLLTLHKSKLDPETISILDEIKDGSKRLEKIINLLLESAKLEAGQLKLNKNKDNLTFLINFCVKELKGLTALRNQSVLFDPDKKVEAMFDKERIYEVISNLLLNAVKYTQPGGTISIQTYMNDIEHIISITDNGIGFTEEEKDQVFKQFGKIERYGQGWDVAIEGTGLGLYITKKLVELHGGKIWLTSEGRNKGTTFKFSIPREK
ncbi:MAG: PAS domain S-box protein [Candidatus Lokiarchaeota archaeon]|nr:PAS domain S-box protein [Candidatus Lokiarchaeota archaeon]